MNFRTDSDTQRAVVNGVDYEITEHYLIEKNVLGDYSRKIDFVTIHSTETSKSACDMDYRVRNKQNARCGSGWITTFDIYLVDDNNDEIFKGSGSIEGKRNPSNQDCIENYLERIYYNSVE